MINTRIGVAAVFLAAFGQLAVAQTPAARDAKGLQPRNTPADYQAAAKAGTVTFGADFAGHGVPTADGVYETEGSVVVELGVYGPAGAHLNVSYKDFSLRINGKKAAIPAQPYEATFSSLKDPEWVPPGEPEQKSKGGVNAGGGGGQGEPPPAPVRMPMNLRLAMEQKVGKASLPEGDRPLPEAGLLFFPQGGKNNKQIELIYNGAAGKVTIPLQ